MTLIEPLSRGLCGSVPKLLRPSRLWSRQTRPQDQHQAQSELDARRLSLTVPGDHKEVSRLVVEKGSAAVPLEFGCRSEPV